MLIDFLECTENQFLALLPVFRLEMGHHFSNDIEIDFLDSRRDVVAGQGFLPKASQNGRRFPGANVSRLYGTRPAERS